MKRSGDSSRQFGYIIKAEVNKSVDRVLEIQMLTAKTGYRYLPARALLNWTEAKRIVRRKPF